MLDCFFSHSVDRVVLKTDNLVHQVILAYFRPEITCQQIQHLEAQDSAFLI